MRGLTTSGNEGQLVIRPRYIDPRYIERCRIPQKDAEYILTILDSVGRQYYSDLTEHSAAHAMQYDLQQVSDRTSLRPPRADLRPIGYVSEGKLQSSSVQVNLKPILSFRHAYRPAELFGCDLRTAVISEIQEQLDKAGLSHYVARPGGLSSVDIALEKVDKAYALEFLLDRLNLSGQSRRGQKFGSNAIYIGDEVIVGGGNDYPVTRIPGLLVFAVNPDQGLIPFLSQVLVPSTIVVGPDATAEVLAQFNRCVLRILSDTTAANGTKTAVDVLKGEVFATRIRAIVARLSNSARTSTEDWQGLHTFVTLLERQDPMVRQWLSMVVDELDALMIYAETIKATGSVKNPV
jgi:hydroxymethylpyrimidine pyrophosphatase-like HAD family hydrolase